MSYSKYNQNKFRFQTLYRKWKDCKRCELCKVRTQVVIGYGNLESRFIIIGQGPGKKENEEGKPFIGPAGKVLTKTLEKCDLSRNDFYITNAVACLTPGNRAPEDKEIKKCNKRLLKIIDILDPLFTICLGKVAAQSIFKDYKDQTLSSIRGLYRRDTLKGKRWIGITHHPCVGIYDPNGQMIKQFRKDWRKFAELVLELKEGI